MRFGGECYQHGFQRSERIVPSGFPVVPFQPVYRYTKADTKSSPLLQIGPGVFSANAVPPYRSWNDFSPIVTQGIEALLNSRDENEKVLPFISASLRYINVFSDKLLLEKSISEFMMDTLGFSVGVPPSISRIAAPDRSVAPFIQLNIPTKGGLLMIISLGEGVVKGSAAVIMDTTVTSTIEQKPDLKEIMDVLNSARSVIHDTFVEMTTPIHNQMKPAET